MKFCKLIPLSAGIFSIFVIEIAHADCSSIYSSGYFSWLTVSNYSDAPVRVQALPKDCTCGSAYESTVPPHSNMTGVGALMDMDCPSQQAEIVYKFTINDQWYTTLTVQKYKGQPAVQSLSTNSGSPPYVLKFDNGTPYSNVDGSTVDAFAAYNK